MTAGTIRISRLYVHPIKSCRGIRVDEVALDRRGVADDRRWMLVDGAGRFISQRTEPRLALVETALVEDRLRLRRPDGDGLELPRSGPKDGPGHEVEVWGDRCEAVEHAEGSAWLSRFLGREARLVHMPDHVERAVDPDHADPGDIVSFADGFPLLLMTEASIEDLSARIGTPMVMERFRPNLVVEGNAPYAEDDWRTLSTGPLTFRCAKPCARCTLPTVDPATGERGKEPLRTLATYRKVGGEVLLGINLVHDAPGRLRVGDEVRVSP